MWDFDSDIATPASSQLDPSKIFGVKIRAYYEGNSLPAGASADSVLIHAQNTRWINYQERDPSAVAEVPPLPPEATNSNSNTGRDGHDAGHRSPPTPPPGPPNQYTHHLIRDFMFQDAAAQNQAASGPPAGVTPQVPQEFTVQFLTLDPNDASEDPDLRRFTHGTKHPLVGNKSSR